MKKFRRTSYRRSYDVFGRFKTRTPDGKNGGRLLSFLDGVITHTIDARARVFCPQGIAAETAASRRVEGGRSLEVDKVAI